MHDDTELKSSLESEANRESWRDRGFDPDIEITEYFGCFTLAEAIRSLVESTRSNPIPVYLASHDGAARIPLVIDLASPRYQPGDVSEDEDLPNWYFEGWRVPSGYSAGRWVEIRRIRIMVFTMTREFADDDMFEWQYIPQLDPSPDV